MKRYSFDSEKLRTFIEDLYPFEGILNPTIDFNLLSKDNFELMCKCIMDVIENPIITEVDDFVPYRQQITIFDDETNKTLNEIFSNNDLMFFGHGGNGKVIMDTEFRCRYSAIDSHFVPLQINDETLAMFKDWPHKSASQIAIMALNIHEFNPIYKYTDDPQRIDKFSIDNEYFVGYYDNSLGKFISNPNFKANHEYNPEATGYEIDNVDMGIVTPSDLPEVREYFRLLYKISRALYFGSTSKYLDEHGALQMKKQVLNTLKKLTELQNQFTPEFFDEYNKKVEEERRKAEEESGPTLGGQSDDDWI